MPAESPTHLPPKGAPVQRPVDIIIPFYENASLVESVFTSIRNCGEELAEYDCRVVAINDSPDHEELRDALSKAASDCKAIPVEVVENKKNLGFVRSSNKGMEIAVRDSRDVLLLNSDTMLFPGAVRELVRVAYADEMIGFVSPRSNNATICTLPHQAGYRTQPPEDAHAAFLTLSQHLPEFHYVPTAVGFCLFIKCDILREFGLFDDRRYKRGYNEENDLIMRANRCGFRAALANRAFVYHEGGSSFDNSDSPSWELERKHAVLLAERYPEYKLSTRRYVTGTHFEAERMLSALVPFSGGRQDLVFDFSNVGSYHCGTYEVAKQVLAKALKSWTDRFHIHVLISEEAKRFHRLEEYSGAFFVPLESNRTFAIALHTGQPFLRDTLLRMSRLAVVNVYMMLDTIALDCLYLNTATGDDLYDMWSSVMSHADGVIYISDFVRQQFNLRFQKRPGLKELVAHLSLDPADYAADCKHPTGEGRYLLVIGNKFEHKRVRPTVEALAKAFLAEKVVAIGLDEASTARNVVCYTSGQLSDERINDLYRHARAVIYPSLYEGFGIPVVKALVHEKPVFARSIAVMREIRERLFDRQNVHLYTSTEELIDRLRTAMPAWTVGGQKPDNCYDWAAVATRIKGLLEEALADHSFSEVLVPRLENSRRWGAPPAQEDQVAPPPVEYSAAETSPAPAVQTDPNDVSTVENQSETAESREVFELRKSLGDRDRQITEIRDSWSWRITASLRMLYGWCLKLARR